jgi:hypothetical protein
MIQRAARGTAEKEISPSPRKDRPDSVQVQARKAVERERRSPFSVYIVPKSIHARILQNLRGASVQIQTSTIYPGTICPGHTLPKSTRAQSAHEPVLARSAQALISICPGNFSGYVRCQPPGSTLGRTVCGTSWLATFRAHVVEYSHVKTEHSVSFTCTHAAA